MEKYNLKLEDVPGAVSEILQRLERIENTVNELKERMNSPEQERNEFLKVEEACQFLKLKKPTIYGMVYRREIPYYKRGARLYFSKEELIDWIKEYPGGDRMDERLNRYF